MDDVAWAKEWARLQSDRGVAEVMAETEDPVATEAAYRRSCEVADPLLREVGFVEYVKTKLADLERRHG